MAETTWYSEGAFCWTECATSHDQASADFYSAVFGWEQDPQDLPMGGRYITLRKGGKSVAATNLQQEQEKTQGIPPHWNLYIAVDDVDQKSKEAEQAGGTILVPPFDVMELGRMSVIQDPTGAAISFWQAKDSPGAEVYAEPNAFTWYELMSRDPQRAVKFYQDLFGYEVKEQESLSGPYWVLMHKGENAAGIYNPPQEYPPSWTPYVHAEDTAATQAKVEQAGGTVMMPATEIPDIGTIAWFADPQGAVFAVIQPPA